MCLITKIITTYFCIQGEDIVKLREEKMILLLFSFNLSKVTNDTEAARFLTFIFNFTFGNPQNHLHRFT